jgi:hypothetical protein
MSHAVGTRPGLRPHLRRPILRVALTPGQPGAWGVKEGRKFSNPYRSISVAAPVASAAEPGSPWPSAPNLARTQPPSSLETHGQLALRGKPSQSKGAQAAQAQRSTPCTRSSRSTASSEESSSRSVRWPRASAASCKLRSNEDPAVCGAFVQSGRRDLNLGPLVPQFQTTVPSRSPGYPGVRLIGLVTRYRDLRVPARSRWFCLVR